MLLWYRSPGDAPAHLLLPKCAFGSPARPCCGRFACSYASSALRFTFSKPNLFLLRRYICIG